VENDGGGDMVMVIWLWWRGSGVDGSGGVAREGE
ncbi:hypothetical protein Tco_0756199, partial [Tanacetum coccineum]